MISGSFMLLFVQDGSVFSRWREGLGIPGGGIDGEEEEVDDEDG